jgi:CO/xanthine dehydrogenase Mo-binding subunit
VAVKDHPEKIMSFAQFSKTVFDNGGFVIGHGSYMMRKFKPMDPKGGFFEGSGNIAFGAMIMDVDVDTKTGQIDIVNVWLAQDAGTPLNMINCEGQAEGGLVHSIGMTLMENLYPYYPNTNFMPKSFRDYIIPTAKDIPPLKYTFVGRPDPNGPYGAKGFSEMSTHFAAAAIGEAVYNAIGVWITSLPITPEKVLRALDEKESSKGA